MPPNPETFKAFSEQIQRESNMHRIEVHHFASPFAPNFPTGGKQWITTGDPVEIVGIGVFWYWKRANSP